MSREQNEVNVSFAELLTAAVENDKGRKLSDTLPPENYAITPQGASMRLPLSALDRAAVIEAEDVGGRPAAHETVGWLQGDAFDSPIMSRLRLVEVRPPQAFPRGNMPFGDQLPSASMQGALTSAALGEGMAFPSIPAVGDQFRFTTAASGLSNAVDVDGTTAVTDAAVGDVFIWRGTVWVKQAEILGGSEYELDSFIEVKSEVSMSALHVAGEHDVDALVLDSHRLAIQVELVAQVLSGDGAGHNLTGLLNVSEISSQQYGGGAPQLPMSAPLLLDVEAAVEDGGGRLPLMAWGVGTDVSDTIRNTAIEAGSWGRVEARGRITLSDIPAQRLGAPFTDTTAILADWRTVIVPVSSELEVVVDRVTKPGTLRLTSRLGVADPIVTHPDAAYILTQA